MLKRSKSEYRGAIRSTLTMDWELEFIFMNEGKEWKFEIKWKGNGNKMGNKIK